MKDRNAFFSRNVVRWIVAAFALGGVSVVDASTYPNARLATLQAAYGNVLGNTSTITIASGTGTPWTTSAYGLPNATGRVGNYGLAQNGTGVVMGGTVKTPLGNTGKVVEAVAKAPITRAGFARAVGGLLTGPVGATALMVGVPLVADWFAQRGVTPNPNPADYPEKPWLMRQKGDGYQYQIQNITGWFGSYQAACSALQAHTMAEYPKIGRNGPSISNAGSTKSSCWFDVAYRDSVSGQRETVWISMPILSQLSNWVDNLPASMDDIAQYMDEPEAPILTPRIVEQAITSAGIDPFGASGPDTSVSGPSSVPGEQKRVSTQIQVQPGTTNQAPPGSSNTQPATRTETSTATHNVSYTDNKVTYNTTTVNNTTITNNVTGDTITNNDTVTETNDDSTAEDKPDFCKQNPGVLACEKPDLDTPDGDIPKATFDVTYQVENSWGSGSCPASVFANINGRSVMVYDWPQTCSYVATYVRPLLLLMCALGALFIVMPGKADA